MYAFLSMWFVQVAEKYVNTARAGDDDAGAAAKKKASRRVSSCDSNNKAERASNRPQRERERLQRERETSNGQTAYLLFLLYLPKLSA